MPVLKRLLLLTLLSLFGISLYMAMFEDNFIYFPAPEIIAEPSDYGMQFEDLHVTTSDGVSLRGWYMPLAGSRFTVIHFHGNAGNISHRLSLYKTWQSLGLSVYAFDYRGYGTSEGEPSEQGLYEDARAVWRDVTIRIGMKPQEIIIAGRSLGAAVAAQLATEEKAAGVILETPFTSISGMASHHYPWLPVRWLARSRFDAQALVEHIHMPLLVIAARDDAIAPSKMAESIFAATNEPKAMVVLPGGHNDFDHYSSEAYKRSWIKWLATLNAPKQLVFQHDG